MDKYEYRLKTEHIKQVAARKEYDEAARLCNTIDWTKIRDVKMLTLVSEVYSAVGQYDDAIDVLQQAYQYATMGRRIVYRLTELALKADSYEDARNYFEEFCRVAPNDQGRYILLYKMAQSQHATLEEKIKILEAYKREDFDERWAYELAVLYAMNAQKGKCVQLCDDIILWFGLGKYVEKALKLKGQFAELTDAQKQKAEEIKRIREEETLMISSTNLDDSSADIKTESAKSEYKAKAAGDVKAASEEKASEHQKAAAPELQKVENPGRAAVPELQKAPHQERAAAPELQKIAAPGRVSTPELQKVTAPGRVSAPELQKVTAPGRVSAPELQKVTAPGRVSAPELQKVESQGRVSAPELHKVETPGRVSAPELQKVESQGRVSAPELHRVEKKGRTSVPELQKVEPAKRVKSFSGEITNDLKTIINVINRSRMEDAGELRPESMKKDKIRKSVKGDTAVLPDFLPAVEDIQDAAEEQKNEPAAEAVVSEEAVSIIEAAANDKPAVVLEEESIPEELLQPAGELLEESDQYVSEEEFADTEEEESEAEDEAGEEEPEAEDEAGEEEPEAEDEAGTEEPEEDETEEESETEEYDDAEEEDEYEEYEEQEGDEYSEYETEYEEYSEGEEYEEQEEADGFEDRYKGNRLSKVSGMPEENPEDLSGVWHFAVQVPVGDDDIELALGFLEDLAENSKRQVPKSVVKITGKKLNQKGLVRSLDKLLGKTILVENAGDMDERVIDEFCKILEPTDRSLLVVFIDTPSAIRRLFVNYPALREIVTAQFIEERYSPAELMDYAKEYADREDSAMDRSGEIILMEQLRVIAENGERDKKKIVETIINRAIEKAEKKSMRSLFQSKYDKNGCLVLREKDFQLN